VNTPVTKKCRMCHYIKPLTEYNCHGNNKTTRFKALCKGCDQASRRDKERSARRSINLERENLCMQYADAIYC